MVSKQQVLDALASVVEKSQNRSIVDLGWVGDIEAKDGAVSIYLQAPASAGASKDAVAEAVRAAAISLEGVLTVEVRYRDPVPARTPKEKDPVPGVKNVVLVMSGKGGVGKSSVASNLTMALKRAGYRVGLLDADIYGPSLPTMFGISARPFSSDGKRIEPLERFGVKLMSIGFLLEDPKAAIIWRGPMLHSALQQFLRDVNWGELDFLLLDLPPGTGDIALTLAQEIALTGAVIVTTPQHVATDDVFKSVSMCHKVNIPIIGVVENMSYFIDSVGVRHELFGAGGGQGVADFAKAPLLGQVPIDPAIREWADKGTPVVQAEPGSAAAKVFTDIADQMLLSIGDEPETDAAPIIDRSGGGGGRRRLPVAK